MNIGLQIGDTCQIEMNQNVFDRQKIETCFVILNLFFGHRNADEKQFPMNLLLQNAQKLAQNLRRSFLVVSLIPSFRRY